MAGEKRRPPVVKLLGYLWASPNTLFGLANGLLTIATGGGVQRIDGVLEFWGGWAAFFLRRLALVPGAAAVTFGHVILAVDRVSLDWARPHEHVHVAQYERWGPFFIPAYVLCWITLWFRGRDPYRDNPFERAAFRDR